jgi:hypothetical protein
MASQIEDFISKCSICQEYQKVQSKEPMIETDLPERPWSKVAADIIHMKDNDHLLLMDYYYKWPEVHKLDNLSSKNTIASTVHSPEMEFQISSSRIMDVSSAVKSSRIVQRNTDLQIVHQSLHICNRMSKQKELYKLSKHC